MKAEHTLIAPLHWGLGHAARCIPIIENELQAGSVVYVAATGGQKALIAEHFDKVIFIEIPFMEITYPRDGNMVWHFTKKGPELLHSIWREHRILNKLIAEKKITKVISDSRFGLWSKKVKSIFISHQIEIQTPVFQTIVNVLNRWVMTQYDEVWIPDYEQKSGLAGKLSHPKNLLKHAKYIGPLSRFKKPGLQTVDPDWDAVALISGPEPQRTLFETEITRQFIESGEKCLILKGKPHEPEHKIIDNITVLHHMNDTDLVNALLSANKIYARSGYSTIMDLNVLGLKANYVATPGQTEQQYLAEIHNR